MCDAHLDLGRLEGRDGAGEGGGNAGHLRSLVDWCLFKERVREWLGTAIGGRLDPESDSFRVQGEALSWERIREKLARYERSFIQGSIAKNRPLHPAIRIS